MHCLSLRHDGEELLADVSAHVPDRPWASGIPQLLPWANRLGGFSYTFDGTTVELAADDLYLEEHDLPLHGLRAAVTGWEVRHASGTRLVGGRRFAARAFPFEHDVEVAAELRADTLTLSTSLTAGERPVPITFGHHPFFRLPGVPRAEWELTLPVAERIAVDAQLIPTGERVPAGDLDGRLGDRTFDDGFTYAGGPFVLAGGGRRIEVVFEQGYGYAQVFAPAVADVVCFEPMTAPADALRHSPPAVDAGDTFTARFSVSIVKASDR
ncbi:aldose 1-epimerase [Solirubrobacter sp. CPCC 204708]|nr:aldose 1-epimerase [Solirubrobacter deserti]